LNDPVLNPTIGWIILGVFSVVWVYLGHFWGKRGGDFEGQMLAGRNIGLALGTATAMATWVTSNTTMAAPELAYRFGIWGMVGYSLGAVGLLLFAPMAERIKHLMPKGYTSGDFVRIRYGYPAWFVFICISVLYGLGWLVSMGMAGGVLLEALTGISYHYGMVVITLVCVGYTLLGGLRAVVGTDFIQSVLILIGLVVVGAVAFTLVPPTQVHEQLEQNRPALLDALMPAAIMFLFNNLLFGLGEIFHSNVWWSRALAFREGVGFKAYLFAGLAWLPVPVAAGSIALTAPALDLNVPKLDMVGPLVAANVLGQFGAVLTFIVVFSSLASSLDSLLAATSDLLVEDIYRRVFRPKAKDKELRTAARLLVLFLGVLSIGLCWPKLATLAKVIAFTGAFVASTIWPIAAGLYWENANKHAATAGMLLGTAAGLASYFIVGWYTAALVSGAVSMVCVLVGRLAPETFAWSKLAQMEDPERDEPVEEAA
jgi:Na+/proline symporter